MLCERFGERLKSYGNFVFDHRLQDWNDFYRPPEGLNVQEFLETDRLEIDWIKDPTAYSCLREMALADAIGSITLDIADAIGSITLDIADVQACQKLASEIQNYAGISPHVQNIYISNIWNFMQESGKDWTGSCQGNRLMQSYECLRILGNDGTYVIAGNLDTNVDAYLLDTLPAARLETA